MARSEQPATKRRSVRSCLLLIGVLLGSIMVSCTSEGSGGLGGLTIGISPGSGILDLDPDEQREQLDRVSSLGAEWVRIDLDWSRIESARGELDWETTDALVEEAGDAGLEVLLLVTYTPSWARPEGASNKHPPSDVSDWEAFVRLAADRYGGSVAAWEIWNEPNVVDFWESGADPRGYATLFEAAARAIRAESPDTTVITGGLAPASNEGDELSPLAFLSELYRYLEPGLADAIAVHPYTFPERPSDGGRNNPFQHLPTIIDLVASEEGRVLPIWLTEFGAPTGTSDKAVSPTEQAEIIADAMRCVRGSDALGPLFLYNLEDPSDADPTDREDNFGLIGADGQPKPAWDAVAEVLNETDDRDPCGS